MKYTIACVFAHPDDESFGPSGTLIKLAAKGNDVYVITATKGQAGQSSDKIIKGDLGAHRVKELEKACRIMGIKPPILLDFFDGTLNEHQMPLLKKSILRKLQRITPDIIIIYEKGGISYHLDHIAVTKAVLLLSEENKIKPKKIYYFGISKELSILLGRQNALDESKLAKIDVSDVYETKIAAMKAHGSQEKDYLRIIKRFEDMKEQAHGKHYEYFSLAKTTLLHLNYPEADLLEGL